MLGLVKNNKSGTPKFSHEHIEPYQMQEERETKVAMRERTKKRINIISRKSHDDDERHNKHFRLEESVIH